MSFYERLRTGTVQKVLRKYGFPVVLSRWEGGEYSPGQPQEVDLVDVEGLGLLDAYRADEINGTTILQGDARLWYEGDAPKVGDEVEIDGASWRVVQLEPIKPGGTTVLWALQIRS